MIEIVPNQPQSQKPTPQINISNPIMKFFLGDSDSLQKLANLINLQNNSNNLEFDKEVHIYKRLASYDIIKQHSISIMMTMFNILFVMILYAFPKVWVVAVMFLVNCIVMAICITKRKGLIGRYQW